MKKNLAYLFSLLVMMCCGTASAEPQYYDAYQASKAQKALFLALTQNTQGTILAAGEHGLILVSNDQGKSWRQSKVPTKNTLTGIAFADDNTAIAVGHDALILRSVDAGANWEVIQSEPELEQPFLNVSFIDEQVGVAVGAYGLYYQTQDAGETWESLYFESLDDPEFGLPHFYALRPIDEQHLILAGEVGFVAESTDGGESWEKLESPYRGSFFNLYIDNASVYLMGLRGHLFAKKLADWQQVKTKTTSSLNGMAKNPQGELVAFGMDGVMLKVLASGQVVFSQRNDRMAISAAVGIDGGFLIAGEGGLFRVYANGEPMK